MIRIFVPVLLAAAPAGAAVVPRLAVPRARPWVATPAPLAAPARPGAFGLAPALRPSLPAAPGLLRGAVARPAAPLAASPVAAVRPGGVFEAADSFGDGPAGAGSHHEGGDGGGRPGSRPTTFDSGESFEPVFAPGIAEPLRAPLRAAFRGRAPALRGFLEGELGVPPGRVATLRVNSAHEHTDGSGRVSYRLDALVRTSVGLMHAGSFVAETDRAGGLGLRRGGPEPGDMVPARLGRSTIVLVKLEVLPGEDWETRLREYFARHGCTLLEANRSGDSFVCLILLPAGAERETLERLTGGRP